MAKLFAVALLPRSRTQVHDSGRPWRSSSPSFIHDVAGGTWNRAAFSGLDGSGLARGAPFRRHGRTAILK